MRYLVSLFLFACGPQPTDSGLPDPVKRPDTDSDSEVVSGVELVAVSYNVESGDAEAATIAANMGHVVGETLWGFSECKNASWLETFRVAADDGGQDFQSILGTTGREDRLGILYDSGVLEYISHEELSNINIGGTARAPLVARFRVRENGVEFLYMVNHLWRTQNDARHEQASMLNTWATQQTLPIVAMGDYNFDWAVDGGDADHDLGYDRLIANSVWRWVRPDDLIPTQCGMSQSVLDFAFVANDALAWDTYSTILFRQNVYCQENAQRPDHRPVEIVFTVPDPQ